MSLGETASQEFADFALNLAYQVYPVESSLIGDAAIRVMVVSASATVLQSPEYQLDLNHAVQTVGVLVGVAKTAYDLYKSRRLPTSEEELVRRVKAKLTSDGIEIEDDVLVAVVHATVGFLGK